MSKMNCLKILCWRPKKEYDTQEVDIREKIREADYEEESFKQWEYSPDEDDDYTYEQYVSEEDTLTDYLFMQLQFSNLKKENMRQSASILSKLSMTTAI